MKVENLRELFNNTAPPPSVVEGLVPEKSITLISGLGHTSKTFLALEMALAVARGEPFLGQLKTKQGTVLYVGEDSPKHDVTRQMRKLLHGHELSGEQVPHEELLFSINEGATIAHEKGTARIAELVLKYDPCLLILDSLRQLTRGIEENDSTQMGQAMGFVRDLADTGPAVVLIHHNSYRGNARGTTAIFDTTDGHLNLTYNKRKDWVDAKVEKRRTIEIPDFAYYHLWDLETAKMEWVDTEAKPDAETQFITAYLTERGWTTTGDAAVVLTSNVKNLTSKAAYHRAARVLQRMQLKGTLTKVKRGVWATAGNEKRAVEEHDRRFGGTEEVKD